LLASCFYAPGPGARAFEVVPTIRRLLVFWNQLLCFWAHTTPWGRF